MNKKDLVTSDYGKFFLECQYYKFYKTTRSGRKEVYKDELFYVHECRTLKHAKEDFMDYEKMSDEEIAKLEKKAKNSDNSRSNNKENKQLGK